MEDRPRWDQTPLRVVWLAWISGRVRCVPRSVSCDPLVGAASAKAGGPAAWVARTMYDVPAWRGTRLLASQSA